MRVYHRTDESDAILSEGFRDSEGGYLTTGRYRGVWVSAEYPLDVNEGADGAAVLELDIPESLFAEFEWTEDGKTYREALIPAERLNRFAVRRLSEDEIDELDASRWRARDDAGQSGS
jgi:hypothetical protein